MNNLEKAAMTAVFFCFYRMQEKERKNLAQIFKRLAEFSRF
ncbi:hypothetical protein ACVR0O_04060 [Streptococcus caviae]|nr:hypothetical protein [Streptococcus sp. 'caviae']